MKQKKNIDQLFNERLANHQEAPDSRVWDNIQARLEKDKKDRVIALWYRVGGVAASLALILYLVGSFGDTQSNSIVEQQIDVKIDNNTTPKINETLEIKLPKYNSGITSTNKETQNQKIKPQIKSKDNTKANKQIIAVSKQENTIARRADSKNPVTASKNLALAVVKPKNTLVLNENKEQIIETVVVAPNSDTAITKTEKTNPISAEKQSIFEAIKEQQQLESKEAVADKSTQKNPWEIAPNVAPVYFNTLSQGSSIDASFADNTQKGDINISYGIGVRYALSDRLKIRSGINNVALSYSTSDIELGDGPISAALTSINYNKEGIVVIAQDLGTFSNQNQDGPFGEITPKSTNGEAFINQNISYYEVPLELSYTVFDSAFGLDIIGGVSTLVLGDNQVSVTAGDYSEVLGSANNLSSISFASNIGLGLHYKMSSRFRFNVEPMFKYQLNPYTDTSVSYKPYYLGVYTGLSFKF